MKKITILTLALMSAAVLASCAGQAQQPASVKGKPDTHVILIGLDGWGSYSMEQADMPTVKQLMDNGAYTLKRRSVVESISSSGPNWACIQMGACQEIHGYTEWDSRAPEVKGNVNYKNNIFPTIAQILRDQRPDAEIGAVYEWQGIYFLIDVLSCDYYGYSRREDNSPADFSLNNNTCELSEKYIKEWKPNLLTIEFNDPDKTGANEGFDSPAYYDKLHELDGYVSRIVQATKDAGIYDNTVFILTADQGSRVSKHGGRTLKEMETPLIFCGKGIRHTGAFEEVTMPYDIAPTIARIFGISTPQEWNGRAMTQVLEQH